MTLNLCVEKLRQSIEIWYATSEYLRQEMTPNFRMTDPFNPVHIMSFSGARGNASQVHQLDGLITSRNMVRALMCLELILNAVNLNFVTFSDFFDSRQLKGAIFSIFVIAIAAAEAAIGLAIVSSRFQ